MTDSEPKVGSNVDADSFGPAWFLERHDFKPISTEHMMSTYQDGGRFGSSAGKRRTDFGGRRRHFCISGLLSAHGSPCWWASTSNKLTELVNVWEDNSADSVIGSRDCTTILDDTNEHGISCDDHGDHDDACSEGEDEYESCWMASNGLTYRNRGTTWFVDEDLWRKVRRRPAVPSSNWVKETFAVRILNTELFSKG